MKSHFFFSENLKNFSTRKKEKKKKQLLSDVDLFHQNYNDLDFVFFFFIFIDSMSMLDLAIH